jgi:hypothetical protein
VRKKDFQYTHVAMPLNSSHRTRTFPDDADGLRANRNPLIEQASTLRKSYFYTNRAYYRRDFGTGVRVTERMASSSDLAAASYPSHGFIFCSRAAALRTVNRLGSNRRLTSFQ